RDHFHHIVIRPLIPRLEIYVEAPVVTLLAAVPAPSWEATVFTAGSCAMMSSSWRRSFAMVSKGVSCVPIADASDQANILNREASLRDDDEQDAGDGDRCDEYSQRDGLKAQRDVQGTAIEHQHGVERAPRKIPTVG